MTQDIQQRIAQGSEDHVDKYGSGYNGINVGKVRKVDFTAGATFVLETILPEQMEKLMDWMAAAQYQIADERFFYRGSQVTIASIIKEYLAETNTQL